MMLGQREVACDGGCRRELRAGRLGSGSAKHGQSRDGIACRLMACLGEVAVCKSYM